jgi:hypothetical protein
MTVFSTESRILGDGPTKPPSNRGRSDEAARRHQNRRRSSNSKKHLQNCSHPADDCLRTSHKRLTLGTFQVR